MASKVTGSTGNYPKRQDKYRRRSSVNDICEHLSQNLASKERVIKHLDKKNESLYSENQQLKKDKIKIEKEKDEALSRAYTKNMESKLTGSTGNYPKRQDKYGRRSSVNDSLNDKCESLSENLASKERVIKILDEENESLYSEIQQLKKDKIKIEKEKDEALSKLNPTIAELGNPNRPSRIGEAWGSLYTDEWMDAYEDITKRCKEIDKQPEKELMRIVQWCYKKCSELAGNQMQVIKKKLCDVACNIHYMDSQATTKPNQRVDDSSRLENTMKSLIENMKAERQTSKSAVEFVKNKSVQDYVSENPETMSGEIKFLRKCSELFWFMYISDPQLVIECVNLEGKVMDTNKFHKYDRTGTIVEFVVWPVLLLHQNGPVLAKGTVQTNWDPDKKKLCRMNDRKDEKRTDISPHTYLYNRGSEMNKHNFENTSESTDCRGDNTDKEQCKRVEVPTKFETKNVGSPKYDTAVDTNSRNNKGGVKPPCLTVVPTNENKTGITDRNSRTNDQTQNQTSCERSCVSSTKTNPAKNITSATVSAEKTSCVNTGTAILNTGQNAYAGRQMVQRTMPTDKSVVHGTTRNPVKTYTGKYQSNPMTNRQYNSQS